MWRHCSSGCEAHSHAWLQSRVTPQSQAAQGLQDPKGVKCALMRQQLKKLAALYLRANVNDIKIAIKKFGLDEIIVCSQDYLCISSASYGTVWACCGVSNAIVPTRWAQ